MKELKISSTIIILFVLIGCSKKSEESIHPKIGPITESVYASGIVKAEGQYSVYPLVSGVLKSIEVEVGETISKDQKLFKIENDKASLATDNSRLAYQLSQENSRYIQDKIAEMETKVQSAKDKLTLDTSIYERTKKVKQYGGISEVDYERVELTFKNSRSSYEAAVKQLQQLKIQLNNDQSRNAINVKINQKSEDDFTVKSAFAGKLFDVLVKPGVLVSPQTQLAIIGKEDSYLLELEVDENDMVKVALGQKIVVTLDSYKNQVFEAIVDKIYPIMDERSRTFKIEAHFITVPRKLYPNLTVEANIIIQTKKKVVTIPKSFLVDNQYVIMENKEKRKVTIGLNDYNYVEILSGLSESESIVKP
ncbi:efflux RND transporter periplasmic adaptor subunit [Flavobacterium sp.]